MARHRHAEAYAALVLAGGYVEAGDSGRVRVLPGQVLIHGAHQAHRDQFSDVGAVVLNIPWFDRFDVATGSVADPDAIARLAEQDATGAALLLRETLTPVDAQLAEWPDKLAAALACSADFRLDNWAETMGLAPQSVSRGFRRAYGVSPKRYRVEQRALRAIGHLPTWRGTLAALAAESGFADQAHLARAVVALTGRTPFQLKVKSVQEGARASR